MRETFEITTPGGLKVKINKWLTGAEKRQISEIYMQPDEIKTRGQRVFEAEDKAIKLLVVEIDGSTENLVERLLALPATEIEAVTAELTPLLNPSAQKKTSTT